MVENQSLPTSPNIGAVNTLLALKKVVPSLPIIEPQKPRVPAPKVVMMRPVTFWLQRRVMVKKPYTAPIMPAMSIAKNIVARMTPNAPEPAFVAMFAPIHPPIAPIHIIPGMPRLRWPDFSTIVSPVEP